MTRDSSHNARRPLLDRLIIGVLLTLAALELTQMAYFTLVTVQIFYTAVTCEGPAETARTDLRALHTALQLHRARTGHYPTTGEGLKPLVDLLVVLELPQDPWQHPYHYALREGRPLLWSLGKDDAPGGARCDADIFNESVDAATDASHPPSP